MAGLVGSGGRLGLRAGRGRAGVVWWAGWGLCGGQGGAGNFNGNTDILEISSQCDVKFLRSNTIEDPRYEGLRLVQRKQ